MIDIIKAIISGVVEGLTEFIPVSSTAHLLLFSWVVDFNSIKNNLFEIVIQFGAILAVCAIYHSRILKIFREYRKKSEQKFVLNLILAFLPAAVFGAVFHDVIKRILFSPLTIAFALIFGGIIMIFIERKKMSSHIFDIEKITPRRALQIGFFQAVAMIPGVSRSGATIIGGLLLGLNRKTAAEFSFFLAIPTIGAASVYDLYKNFEQLTFDNFTIICAGFLSAFIASILVIKWFIGYVSKNSFVPFAIYRIVLGGVILFFIL